MIGKTILERFQFRRSSGLSSYHQVYVALAVPGDSDDRFAVKRIRAMPMRSFSCGAPSPQAPARIAGTLTRCNPCDYAVTRAPTGLRVLRECKFSINSRVRFFSRSCVVTPNGIRVLGLRGTDCEPARRRAGSQRAESRSAKEQALITRAWHEYNLRGCAVASRPAPGRRRRCGFRATPRSGYV